MINPVLKVPGPDDLISHQPAYYGGADNQPTFWGAARRGSPKPEELSYLGRPQRLPDIGNSRSSYYGGAAADNQPGYFGGLRQGPFDIRRLPAQPRRVHQESVPSEHDVMHTIGDLEEHHTVGPVH
ncbi:uncharacterized protein LOC144100086 [Amblyomma americanum]